MKRSWLVPFAVGILTFAVWMLTRAPGLTYTDSGELAAAASVWGVAHPSGYPLFTLLGHVWLMLPWPSAIVGMGILCALIVSAACASMVPLMLVALQRIGTTGVRATVIAVGSALALAFAAVTWQQATGVEVYGLNMLLLVAALWATLRSHDPVHAARYTVLAGLFSGLAIANHLSIVFVLPGAFWLWYAGTNRAERIQLLPWLIAPALIGVTLYALLPLRSAAEPPINWGMVHRSWEAILYHVKGTQFGVWMFKDSEATNRNLKFIVETVLTSVAWIGIVPVLTGVVSMIRKQRHVAIGLLLMVLGNVVITAGYAIPDIESYVIPTLVVMTMLMGVGVAKLTEHPSRVRMAYAIAAVPLFSLVSGWKTNDLSDFRGVEAYSRWMLANADSGAVIISHQWDYAVSALWYLQTVEGVRPDVVIIDKELLRRTWYLPHLRRTMPDVFEGLDAEVEAYMTMLEMFERDSDAFMERKGDAALIQARFIDLLNGILRGNAERPLYVTPEVAMGEPGFAAGYGSVQAGPLVRLVPAGDVPPAAKVRLDHVDELVASLTGRDGRLDKGIRQMAIAGLTETAVIALKERQDTATFRRIVDYARQMDARSRAVRYLGTLLP